MSVRSRLLTVLEHPDRAGTLDVQGWADVLGTARHSSLLPRLSLVIGDERVATLPDRVQQQLLAARPLAEQHARSIRWEVNRIHAALRGLSTKVVVLKGAAYVMAGLPAGIGRLATDVDILVPREDLRSVESALLASGWQAVKLHPYDQRFYREWAHELPPLQHARRRSVVDVHHNILPSSGRLHPDAKALLAAAVPLTAPGAPAGLWTLAPDDMVLHSAAHLFQDGDLAGNVRDVVDLDALLRHSASHVPGFWERLPNRARELGLSRPLYYALRYTRLMTHTPVPDQVMRDVPGPPAPVRALMDRLVAKSLLPVSGRHGTFGEETARLLLYIRSHWLRMPAPRLASHLFQKAIRRVTGDEDDEAG